MYCTQTHNKHNVSWKWRKKAPAEKPETYLTTEEQQIVSYVAGYVVFSLRRKYFKIKSESDKLTDVAIAVLQFLESLKANGDEIIKCKSFLDYTTVMLIK